MRRHLGDKDLLQGMEHQVPTEPEFASSCARRLTGCCAFTEHADAVKVSDHGINWTLARQPDILATDTTHRSPQGPPSAFIHDAVQVRMPQYMVKMTTIRAQGTGRLLAGTMSLVGTAHRNQTDV